MAVVRKVVDPTKFNSTPELPYGLRIKDFEMAMQDVYDFLFDVNANLVAKRIKRLDDMLRPAMIYLDR